jgi:hypothetical protein
MKALELLETYEKAAETVKEYLRDKLIESLNTTELPEDFKEFARQQQIDNDKVAGIIDSAPGALFEIFDKNDIYIVIDVNFIPGKPASFLHVSNMGSLPLNFSTRKEAELSAITEAFQILNDKL